jgi:hypothetical protein
LTASLKAAWARPSSCDNVRALILLNGAHFTTTETAKRMQFSERSDPTIDLHERHWHLAGRARRETIIVLHSHPRFLGHRPWR